METTSLGHIDSAPQSELAAIFAAAIRRLLVRTAETSPNSPEFSARGLDVRPQAGLNGRRAQELASVCRPREYDDHGRVCAIQWQNLT
jgi:hypothetical protein